MNRVYTYRKEFAPVGANFLCVKVDPCITVKAKMKMTELLPMKVYSFTLQEKFLSCKEKKSLFLRKKFAYVVLRVRVDPYYFKAKMKMAGLHSLKVHPF